MRQIPFIVLVLLMFYLSACTSARAARESEVQAWIQTAQRPIKVEAHSNADFASTTRGHTCYTLVDQSGKVYFAKNVRFKLPDVIE